MEMGDFMEPGQRLCPGSNTEELSRYLEFFLCKE